jgi:hypothetical protein
MGKETSFSNPDFMDAFNHLYMVLLPAAVVAMWLVFKQRADLCEKDRHQLWKAISKLSGIVHAASSCPVTGCGLRDQAGKALEASEDDLDPDEAKKKTLYELGIPEKGGVCYHVPSNVQ